MPNRRDPPWLPPRWFIRLVWYAHRGLYRVTRGRIGLWRPKGTRWGTLRLTTTGGADRPGAQRDRRVLRGWLQPRHDGDERLGKGGAGVVAEPPGASGRTGRLVDGPRLVRAHAATGDESVRLWERWRQLDANLDAYAALRPSETAVVVLEPQPRG
jgi:F420H(2)-dependent quinone reductase